MIEESNKLWANNGKPDSMIEQYHGINVIAKDAPDDYLACGSCALEFKSCMHIPCTPTAREDNRNVYFVEVKDYEKST